MSIRNELLERILAAILSSGGNPQDVRVEPAGNYTLDSQDDDVLFSVAATLTTGLASSLIKSVHVTATSGNVSIDVGGQTINGIAGPYAVVAPNSVRLTPYSGGFFGVSDSGLQIQYTRISP